MTQTTPTLPRITEGTTTPDLGALYSCTFPQVGPGPRDPFRRTFFSVNLFTFPTCLPWIDPSLPLLGKTLFLTIHVYGTPPPCTSLRVSVWCPVKTFGPSTVPLSGRLQSSPVRSGKTHQTWNWSPVTPRCLPKLVPQVIKWQSETQTRPTPCWEKRKNGTLVETPFGTFFQPR